MSERAAEQSEDVEMVNAVTAIVREADDRFTKAGGTSRHWVRDWFLPILNEKGWQVVPVLSSLPPVRGEEQTEPTTIRLPDAVSLKMLENENAILRRRLDECRPYLKDGESPAQCIARNRADVDLALGLLAKEKQKTEVLPPVRGEQETEPELKLCSCVGHCRGREGLSQRFTCALDTKRGKVPFASPVRAEAAKTPITDCPDCRCTSGVHAHYCRFFPGNPSPVREAEHASCHHCGWISRDVICRKCGRERNSGIRPLPPLVCKACEEGAHRDCQPNGCNCQTCRPSVSAGLREAEPLKALVVEAVELLKHVRVLDCGAHYCRYCPAKSPEWEHTPSCPYEESQVVSERARVLRQKLSAALEGAATKGQDQ